MTQEQADATGWRGTDQGTQLKAPNSSSELNVPLAGRRDYVPFNYLSSYAFLWSSSESSTNAWRRAFSLTSITMNRTNQYPKAYGFSIRCLGN